MADVDIERRSQGSLFPWLLALGILILLVGWLIWRNNRLPQTQGRVEPVGAPSLAARTRAAEEAAVLAEALPVASEPLEEEGASLGGA